MRRLLARWRCELIGVCSPDWLVLSERGRIPAPSTPPYGRLFGGSLGQEAGEHPLHPPKKEKKKVAKKKRKYINLVVVDRTKYRTNAVFWLFSSVFPVDNLWITCG